MGMPNTNYKGFNVVVSLAIGKLSHIITVLGSMAAKYDFLRKLYISLAAILEIAPYDPDGHGNSPGDKSNI